MNDFDLDAYDYDLPETQIAQFPPQRRGDSRLMILAGNAPPKHAMFAQLCDYLPKGSVLVFNNSRVIPARMAYNRPGGGKSEIMLLTPLPMLLKNAEMTADGAMAKVECLVKPAAKVRTGQSIELASNLHIKIIAKKEFGQCEAELHWQGDIRDILENLGTIPLPPYIKREPIREDYSRYQTIYAKNNGSIAAPTAGLHFTKEMLAQLDKAGCVLAEITLHVGYGTFAPVRCNDIREHHMHCEYASIDEKTAAQLAVAKQEGRPIIAVGTTSLRTLEGVFAQTGKIAQFDGYIDAFIYPGYRFEVVSGLFTNFHLPKSTLLMLVSAFAGRARVLSAYREAVAQNYRFFSYGDAMLIHANP